MRIRGIAPGGPGRREDRGLERQRPLSCISAGLDVAPLPWRYLDSRSPLLPLCIILTLTRLASTLTRRGPRIPHRCLCIALQRKRRTAPPVLPLCLNWGREFRRGV